MGVFSVLLSVFFGVAFGTVGYLVRSSGWRSAWAQMAFVLLVIILPLTLLILRRPTRDYSNQRAAENATEANGFTLAEALRTPAFWAFAGAGAAFNMVSSGLGLFNESVLNERGFDQKTFHDFLVFTTLISLAGQFGCGWLSRRFSYQTLTCLALLLYGFGLGLIPLVTQHWQLWGLAVLIGASGGMIMVVFFSVWSDVFGPVSYTHLTLPTSDLV